MLKLKSSFLFIAFIIFTQGLAFSAASVPALKTGIITKRKRVLRRSNGKLVFSKETSGLFDGNNKKFRGSFSFSPAPKKVVKDLEEQSLEKLEIDFEKLENLFNTLFKSREIDESCNGLSHIIEEEWVLNDQTDKEEFFKLTKKKLVKLLKEKFGFKQILIFKHPGDSRIFNVVMSISEEKEKRRHYDYLNHFFGIAVPTEEEILLMEENDETDTEPLSDADDLDLSCAEILFEEDGAELSICPEHSDFKTDEDKLYTVTV